MQFQNFLLKDFVSLDLDVSIINFITVTMHFMLQLHVNIEIISSCYFFVFNQNEGLVNLR